MNDRTPYSVRVPPEMMDEIRQMATDDQRSIHSMMLILLGDGLRARRAVAPAPSNAVTASPVAQAAPTRPAFQAVSAS